MYHMHILILIETKVTSDRAVKVPQEFGSLYPQSDLTFGNSSGGGIWVFWDPARLQVSKLSGSAQHASFRALPTAGNARPFLFSAIYASPIWRLRRTLWNDLALFRNSFVGCEDAWLLMGGLNCLLGQHEKQGGRV